MKKERHFGLRIDDTLLKKFRYVCEYYGRSANMQLIQTIRHIVDKFEKEHGEIYIDNDENIVRENNNKS